MPELTAHEKRMLVIGVVAAAAIALVFFVLQKRASMISAGPAVLNEGIVPNATAEYPTGYTQYNLQPLAPEPLGTSVAPAASTTDSSCGCGCGSTSLCSGNGNQLGDGNTYSSLGQYLSYLEQLTANAVSQYHTQVTNSTPLVTPTSGTIH